MKSEIKNNLFATYALSEQIIEAVSKLGYTKPTPVQEAVIPEILAGRDVLVQSQTGSGKTASFGIPLCEKIDWAENKPQVLILEPTRELAQQVQEDLTNIGRYKRIKATAVYGKASFVKQKSELKQKSHIVVGTPGRVLDHISKGTFPLEKLAYLVIDEADEMLNMGFIEQVEQIIEALPENKVTQLFSATMPEKIEQMSTRYLVQPTVIQIEATQATIPKIQHAFIDIEPTEKLDALVALTVVENPDACIIFCNTQEKVNATYQFLAQKGYICDKLHGGMIQEDRFAVMDEFKQGKFRYLIATDVAARGIDIENITHVINFDVPFEKENYVHRVGRTARAGKEGYALTFVTPKERDSKIDIEDFARLTMEKINVPPKRTVERSKAAFEQKMQQLPKPKRPKNKNLNQQITKLYFNGGKKKKLRAVDFVGTIAKIKGILSEDIGIITIQENVTYVEILNGKGQIVLEEMKNRTIKGKQLKVHIARK